MKREVSPPAPVEHRLGPVKPGLQSWLLHLLARRPLESDPTILRLFPHPGDGGDDAFLGALLVDELRRCLSPRAQGPAQSHPTDASVATPPWQASHVHVLSFGARTRRGECQSQTPK